MRKLVVVNRQLESEIATSGKKAQTTFSLSDIFRGRHWVFLEFHLALNYTIIYEVIEEPVHVSETNESNIRFG